jgi:hypothetical protein
LVSRSGQLDTGNLLAVVTARRGPHYIASAAAAAQLTATGPE